MLAGPARSYQQRPVRRLLLGHIHRVGRTAHHILRPLLAARGCDHRLAVLQQVGRVQFMLFSTIRKYFFPLYLQRWG